MWILLVPSFVLAAETAWYHPDDVAAASKVFGVLSGELAPRYEDLTSRMENGSAAGAEIELGVALLGTEATPELTAWAESTRRQIAGEVLRARRHMELLAEDYSKVFGASLERALLLERQTYTLTECEAASPLPGLSKRGCTGTARSAALAARMDVDAGLSAELASIASVTWPTVPLPEGAQPPVPLTGTTRWVSLARVAKALIGAHLSARQDDLDVALEAEAEGIDARDPAAIARAQGLRATWATSVGTAGASLRTGVGHSLERQARKGGPTEIGWCLNPKSLGGCTGEDVSASVIEALKADKALAKSLAPLSR